MEHELATSSIEQEQVKAPASSSSVQAKSIVGGRVHPVLGLQRKVGNQIVQRMVHSGRDDIQPRRHMNIPRAGVGAPTALAQPVLQRKCACGGAQGEDGECAECRKKREEMLQRSAGGSGAVDTIPPVVHEVLSSPGQDLDTGTRDFMETRFGYDFSKVRVHKGAKAAESARAVNALAYTVGQNMVFGEGQYAPMTGGGKKLIAHELTHVVQQSSGLSTKKPGVDSGSADPLEQAADRQAEAVMAESAVKYPTSLISSVPQIQRQQSPGLEPGSQPPPDQTFWQIWGSQIEMFRRMYNEYRYGCWCGPKHVCEHDNIDAIDNSCKTHDLAYDKLHVSDSDPGTGQVDMWSIEGFRRTIAADLELVDSLKKTIFDLHFYGPAAAVYRSGAIALFSGRATIGAWIVTMGIGSPTSSLAIHQDVALDPTSQKRLNTDIDISDIILFNAKTFAKELFSKDIGNISFEKAVDIPYIGPVVLKASVNGIATSNMFATLGPGVLRGSKIMLHPSTGRYTATTQVFVPLGGEIGLNLDGIIGGNADYLGHISVLALKGILSAGGTGKLSGDFTITPEVTYDNGDLSFSSRSQVDSCIQLTFNLNASAEASVLPALEKISSWLSFQWGKRWSLANWVWKYCYELGSSFSLGYQKGQPTFSLDVIAKQITFKDLIHDLLGNASEHDLVQPHAPGQPGLAPSSLGGQPAQPAQPATPAPTTPKDTTDPAPTGLNENDPIHMAWMKLPYDKGYYPDPIILDGRKYYRDDPSELPHGEILGVEAGYWPSIGKIMRKQFLLAEEIRRPGARRFRTTLNGYGFQWSNLEADHVQDILWEGPDSFENIWPMDGSANSSAGSRQNIHQPVRYSKKPGTPAIDTYIGDPDLLLRYFVIISVQDRYLDENSL